MQRILVSIQHRDTFIYFYSIESSFVYNCILKQNEITKKCELFCVETKYPSKCHVTFPVIAKLNGLISIICHCVMEQSAKDNPNSYNTKSK